MTMNQNSTILLSLVFSFRNEENVLLEAIDRLRSVLSSEIKKGVISDYELIFVNDASTDNSLEVLSKEAERHRDIRILNMSRRFGVTPCVLAGLEYTRGDAVIYMDIDLQDPPEVIPQLIDAWRQEETVDVVHTVRRSRQGESFFKRLITRIGYHILHRVTSIKLPIEAGDFKLLSKRVVNEILKCKEKKPFMRGLVCWVGFKQVFVHYDRQERKHGKTKFPILSSGVIQNFFESALISFSSLPLRIASYLGFFSLFVSLFVVFHVLSEKIQGKAIPGWSALMMTVIFIGGIQIFCIGIVGLYLSSMFEEGKGRPNYIVESTFGFPFSSSSPNPSDKTAQNANSQNRPVEHISRNEKI